MMSYSSYEVCVPQMFCLLELHERCFFSPVILLLYCVDSSRELSDGGTIFSESILDWIFC